MGATGWGASRKKGMETKRRGLAALLAVVTLAGSAVAQDKPADKKTKLPRTSEAVYEQLEKPVHLLFNVIEFTEVVATIESTADGAVVVVDGEVAKAAAVSKIYLRVRGCSLAKALDILLVAVPGDPTIEVWRGTIFLSSASHPRPVPPVAVLTDEAKRAFEERRIDLDWRDKPLGEVASELSKAAGLALTLGEGVEGKVTLRGKDVALGCAVDLVCRLVGLKVVTTDGQVQLVRVQDGDLPGPAEPVPAFVKASEDRTSQEAGTGSVARKLLHTTLTASFKAAPLADVVRTVQKKGEIKIVIDKDVDARTPVTLELAGSTLKSALNQAMEQAGCWFEIGAGLVRVHRKAKDK